MVKTFALVLLGITVAPVASLAQSPATATDVAPTPKTVLVTGASTGIGRKITERLAAHGYFVYAGARKEEDLKALGAIKNVQALRLDVTKQPDIDAAVESIRKGGRGLYGLVNNAGVATVGSLATMKPEEFDLVMAVNVYGPYRMARALEPLISAAKGRITNIGSISGILASANLTAYAMSKHALEAFTDSLAQQLSDSGVTVNIVEPGNYNSDIGKSAARRLGADAKALQGPGYKLTADRSKYKEPDEVADAVEKALFEPNPKRRYMVVPNQEEAEYTIKKQIAQLAQLNEDHTYSYDRDALVKMLDEALAQTRPKAH